MRSVKEIQKEIEDTEQAVHSASSLCLFGMMTDDDDSPIAHNWGMKAYAEQAKLTKLRHELKDAQTQEKDE